MNDNNKRLRMQVVMPLAISISCLLLLACTERQQGKILGEWVITKNITPTGYFVNSNKFDEKINSQITFNTDSIVFEKIEYRNIKYKLINVTKDDLIRSWRIEAQAIGADKYPIRLIEISHEGNRRQSNFNIIYGCYYLIVKDDNTLVAITGDGLYEFRKITK